MGKYLSLRTNESDYCDHVFELNNTINKVSLIENTDNVLFEKYNVFFKIYVEQISEPCMLFQGGSEITEMLLDGKIINYTQFDPTWWSRGQQIAIQFDSIGEHILGFRLPYTNSGIDSIYGNGGSGNMVAYKFIAIQFLETLPNLLLGQLSGKYFNGKTNEPIHFYFNSITSNDLYSIDLFGNLGTNRYIHYPIENEKIINLIFKNCPIQNSNFLDLEATKIGDQNFYYPSLGLNQINSDAIELDLSKFTEIGENCFTNIKVSKLILSDELEEISIGCFQDLAFSDNAEIIFGESLTNLGYLTEGDNSSVVTFKRRDSSKPKKIIFKNSVPPFGLDFFIYNFNIYNDIYNLTYHHNDENYEYTGPYIYVPEGSKSAYLAASSNYGPGTAHEVGLSDMIKEY